MPRYVILEHDWPTTHWDFLLERENALQAWRLLSEPGQCEPVIAEPNVDHRPLYLSYEGPIGGGRGHVRQWDSGQFEWVSDGDVILLTVRGRRLQGRIYLTRDGESWLWRLESATET